MQGLVVFLLVALCFGRPPDENQPMDVTGVVDHVQGQTAVIRTHDSDLTIDLSKLDASNVKLLKTPDSKSKIFSTQIPQAALTSRELTPLGIRPDCSELPMSVKELDGILTSDKVNNIVEFNKALPKGTFQGFTLVYNSLSAQKGEGHSKVRPLWPRVLRTSADGTITFTYTCDPESETYNNVEMLFFDKEKDQLVDRSYNLDKPPGAVGKGHRVDYDPNSCKTCHTTGHKIQGEHSLKHNWNQYFTWSGCEDYVGVSTYGGNDDHMEPGGYFRSAFSKTKYEGCSESDLESFSTKERNNFAEFKELQKDNPCYNLLPWIQNGKTEKDGVDYRFYPYRKDPQRKESTQTQDYETRTNLRFTDMYTHQLARRNSRLFTRNPRYDRMKYFLAMSAAQCSMGTEEKDLLKKVAPDIAELYGKYESYRGGSGKDPRSSPFVYAFGEDTGLRPADWSMDYFGDTDYESPKYIGALSSGPYFRGDYHPSDIVNGLVLSELAKSDSGLNNIVEGKFDGGIEYDFGKEFSCIDDLGKAIDDRLRGNEKLCNYLKEKNRTHLATILKEDCAPGNPAPNHTAEISQISDPLDKFRDELEAMEREELLKSIERGKNIVQGERGACVKCHSRTEENLKENPANFLFMPSDSISADERQKSVTVLKKLMGQGLDKDINFNLEMGWMPLGKTRKALNDQERGDVMNYVKNLAVEHLNPKKASHHP